MSLQELTATAPYWAYAFNVEKDIARLHFSCVIVPIQLGDGQIVCWSRYLLVEVFRRDNRLRLSVGWFSLN